MKLPSTKLCAAAWLALALVAPSPVEAKVKPFALFSDHAVLQRAAKVPVWGTTDRDEAVQVTFGEQMVTAKPKDGKWRVDLVDLKYGGPHTLTISQGRDRVELNDILVGEVWLCGGQSNMEWPVKRSTGAEQTIAASDNSKLRLYTDPSGIWQAASPRSVPEFSAVGYHFGLELQKAQAVPFGLISCNQGGTTAERWMSREAIAASPEVTAMRKPQGASDLFERKIAPLVPYSIRGVIWYQGEANTPQAFQYRWVLPALIENWRAIWERGAFPFMVVELAPFGKPADEPGESDWAELREAQLLTTQHVRYAPLCVITDLGDANIHPPKKAEVGARLARIAKALYYSGGGPYSGPVYDWREIRGDRIVLHFMHATSGLAAKGDKLLGFTIAGVDRKFYPAEASIEGETVVVHSQEVAKPVAVRYGWATYPVVNLWNNDGLPASPFRTDAFLLSTQRNADKSGTLEAPTNRR